MKISSYFYIHYPKNNDDWFGDIQLVLTVGDLFCGAGGFSEGFRQTSGFKIKWALDNWKPAVHTYQKNHGLKVISKNIMDCDFKNLDHVDVLIGSPPCVHFSIAKNGGNGNNLEGMKLVEKFFEAVNCLNPKYWIMENVPNIRKTLTQFIKNDVFENNGLERLIPKMKLLNSADFGVPQKRKRLFLGNFPSPEQTHVKKNENKISDGKKTWKTMKNVLDHLPHPFSSSATVTDPLYNLQIPGDTLTEQFYISYLTAEECFICKKMKEDHPWAGKMLFPDDLNRPSRTITASNHGCGRHTIVIKDSVQFETYYRNPTLRELACFQSFPITYQFWGKTLSERHRLIGNAVPPLLSFALAKAILKKEGYEIPKNPIILPRNKGYPVPLKKNSMTHIGKKIKVSLRRRFRDHIPNSITNHSKNGCRVDFDNKGLNPCLHPMIDFEDATQYQEVIKHLVKWRTVLYTGYAKTVRNEEISVYDALELLVNAEKEKMLDNEVTDSFLEKLISEVPKNTPDASTLQATWAKHWKNVDVSPYTITNSIASMIEELFPINSYDWSVRISRTHPVKIAPEKGIPVRTVAQLFACAFACEVINCSDEWIRKNWGNHFHKQDWPQIHPPSSIVAKWNEGDKIKVKLEYLRKKKSSLQ